MFFTTTSRAHHHLGIVGPRVLVRRHVSDLESSRAPRGSPSAPFESTRLRSLCPRAASSGDALREPGCELRRDEKVQDQRTRTGLEARASALPGSIALSSQRGEDTGRARGSGAHIVLTQTAARCAMCPTLPSQRPAPPVRFTPRLARCRTSNVPSDSKTCKSAFACQRRTWPSRWVSARGCGPPHAP